MPETIGLRAVIDLRQFNAATSSYNKSLGRMNKNTTSFTSSAGQSFTGLGKSMLSVGAIAGGAALAGITALTAGLIAFGRASVREGAAYTKAMSNVAAITGATAQEFDLLSASAEELGKTTKFTAIEAAEGMSFLAMAGFEVVDIIGAMPGVLNLAAAGNLQLGRASDIVSNILTGFGADALQTGKFVDVLTKTFTSSNTTLEQLGQGMKFVAPVAADFGISVEDVAAAMGTMGDAGIQASMAGTGLRTILLKLASPTGKAKDLIKELGLEVFDAEGNMLPFPQVIGNVNKALEGMSQEQRAATLETLVGKRAISAFSILLKKGETGLQDFGDELRESGGTAAEIAATQLDNLSGDVTLFQSALSGIKIDVFKALEPLLRGVAKQGKVLLEAFGPQLVAAFGKISDAIGTLIDFGKNLFTIFERGGTAGLAEVLGISPEIVELISKISQAFTDVGIALGLIAPPQDFSMAFFGEDVGQSPLMTGLTFLVNNIIPALNAAIVFVNQNFEAFKGAILGVGAVLAGAAIAAALSAIVTVIGTILSPIGLLIIAAGALGAAWATNWMGIREITASTIATVTAIIMALVSTFQTQVLPPLQAAFANITQALNNLGLDWGDVWNAILEATKFVAIGIGIVIGLVVTTVVGFATGIATALEVATRFIDDFGRAFTTIFEGIINVISGVVGFVQAIIAGEWATAWDSFLQIFLGIQQLFLGGMDLMSTTLETLFSTSLAFIAGFAQGVIDIFTNLSNVLVGNSIIPDMARSIVEVFQMMIQPILNTFNRLAEGISGVLGSLFAGAGGEGLNLDLSVLTDVLPQAIAENVTLIQSMITALGALVSSLGTPLQTAMKKFQEAMVSGFSLVFNQLDMIVKTITLMITKLLPDLGLATGDATTEMEDALNVILGIFKEIESSLSLLAVTIGALSTNFNIVGASVDTLTGKLGELKTKLGKVEDSAEDAADAFEDFRDSISIINNVRNAVNLLRDALKEVVTQAGLAQTSLTDLGVTAPGGGPFVKSQPGASPVSAGRSSSVSTVNNTSTSTQIFNISFGSSEIGMSEAEAALLMRQNIQRQLSTV
jgi:TP901 family phage tail tape measure protein